LNGKFSFIGLILKLTFILHQIVSGSKHLSFAGFYNLDYTWEIWISHTLVPDLPYQCALYRVSC